MTPLQRATESSTIPKSVMKTMVGGGCWAEFCARTELATRNKQTNHRQNIRDSVAGGNVIRIMSNSPIGKLWLAEVAGRSSAPEQNLRPETNRQTTDRIFAIRLPEGMSSA